MDIKQKLTDISRKMDDLLDDSVTMGLMKLSEDSISELYEGEPDLYSIKDLKSGSNEGKDSPDTVPLY
jgi:hypothetical protein